MKYQVVASVKSIALSNKSNTRFHSGECGGHQGCSARNVWTNILLRAGRDYLDLEELHCTSSLPYISQDKDTVEEKSEEDLQRATA